MVLVYMSADLINFAMLDISQPDALRRKLYQLIISRLDGENIGSGSYREGISELVRKGVGGFIIFGGRRNEVKYFIENLQSVAEVRLLIASDVERGVAQQIRDTAIFPSQMAVAGAIDRNRPEDVAILESAVRAIVDESKDVGINMPLIPVLDVNRNPDNPIICTRAFSDNPEDVSWYGSEYIKILESSGLISCAKHFPGHGDTPADSHISLPVIAKSYGALMDVDIAPFEKAINSGVSSIMVGHLRIPAVDDKPASLSKPITTGILGEKLGFKGLIVTDALNMNALKGFKNVPSECIKAGADVLLHPLDADSTVEGLLTAVETKEISEAQIDAAVSRILEVKGKIKYDRQEFDYSNHERLSSLITEMSVTLVKDTAGILPLADGNVAHLFLSGDHKLFESSPLKGYFRHVSTVKEDSFRKLNSSLPLAKPDQSFPPLVKGGEGGFSGETAVFAIFTSVAAWRGSSGIEEDEKKRISELIRDVKKSVVISFGSPYVLRHFGEADLLIAAYEPTGQAQRAVIKCLRGELNFRGRLPVRLDI
jgi:beta-glucosidase-like glycosyl hydrolase